MTILFRVASILLMILGIAGFVYGIAESSWIGLGIFGVLSSFATFFFILSHPAHEAH